MKKIKIMLFSLALLSVIGGALAFKATFDVPFCTTDAYFDGTQQIYYCTFSFLGGGGIQTTTKQCGPEPIGGFIVDPFGVRKICITDPIEEGCPIDCPNVTSLKTLPI